MRRFEHLEPWIPLAIVLIAFLVERGRKALAAAAQRRSRPGVPLRYEPIEPESPWRRSRDGDATLPSLRDVPVDRREEP